MLLRVERSPDPGVFDLYPYAMTNPIWLQPDAGASRPTMPHTWLHGSSAIAPRRDDYNTPEERGDHPYLSPRAIATRSWRGCALMTLSRFASMGSADLIRCGGLDLTLGLVGARSVRFAAIPAAQPPTIDSASTTSSASPTWPSLNFAGGQTLVYSATSANIEADKPQTDLWRVRWDGTERQALTQTPEFSEWHPSFSPDGRTLAFLADRGDEDATTQVWIMPTAGGEARKLTDFTGGVTDFDWSPDGKRLAFLASDDERAPGVATPKNPPPIVTARYYLARRTNPITSVTCDNTCTCTSSRAGSSRSSRAARTTSTCPSGRPTAR
jgi:hypothetical protein